MNQQQPDLTIYTDGACATNPGVGGWAWIRLGTREVVDSGSEPNTTNNRMELRAAIEALQALDGPQRVRIVSDSRYLIDGATKWIHAWQRRGWRRRVKKQQVPVKNQDQWEVIAALQAYHQVEWLWVRGHAGDYFNERCDALAEAAAAAREAQLQPLWVRPAAARRPWWRRDRPRQPAPAPEPQARQLQLWPQIADPMEPRLVKTPRA